VRRWDPLQEIEGLYDQLGQLMQTTFGDSAMPAIVDVEETDDAYIVDLDMPGVRRDDVNVEVVDNTLRITGEVKEKERTGVLRRQTRRVGAFEHVMALPAEVDPENVEATLHDGVLTVRLGKASRAKPRRVEVKES
jgi:HSP20 family protein